MVFIMRGVLWKGTFLVLLELGFCEFCPDLSEECKHINITISNDTALCNLTFIRDVCRTTCKVDRLDCSTACSAFNYIGYEAFIIYAIGLFLLLIIGILSYSYFVDSRPARTSSNRGNEKEIQLVDPNTVSKSHMRLDSNPNVDLRDKIPSPSDYYRDEQRNRTESDLRGSLLTDEMRRMKRPSYEEIDSPSKIAPMDSYPASVMKGSIRGGHELEEADGAEYLDEDDDFFKHALIPEDDSYPSDFVPSAPYHVGGPMQSPALGTKLKAHGAAHPKGNKGISALPLQQEAYVQSRKKKRRSGAQQRSPNHQERFPSPKERLSSLSPRDYLSTPNGANKIPLISSDERLSDRQSNVNRLNDTLHSLSDMGIDEERSSDLRLFGEPSYDAAGHKRLLGKPRDSKKDWYALGQKHTRGHGESYASEGMEPYAQPHKKHWHEGIERGRLPKVRGQEIQKVNEGQRRGKTNYSLQFPFRDGEADRGEPSPSPSIIKTDPDEKASDTAGDDTTFGKSRSSKTVQHTSPKERDTIHVSQVIVRSSVKA